MSCHGGATSSIRPVWPVGRALAATNWRSYDARVTSSKDLTFKLFTSIHRAVYDLSKGKLGGKTMGMPVLKLTTVGRKSGDRRTTMLTSPLIEGDDVILVASFGGDDRNPAWFLNLVAEPDVEIDIDGAKRRMRARVAEGDERSRLWESVTAKHANYADYQRRTDRQIPVVVLSPR
jgi:deazaflavin-dependent oxidoreductase (nitroreductase family)